MEVGGGFHGQELACRRSYHQDARLNGRRTDDRGERQNALRRMPSALFVHGLEVVGAQQQNHQRQRLMDFDALAHPGQAVAL